MSSHILVVEDDGRIADLIARNLQAAGFSCVLAADGDQALAEFRRAKPVLVVLDLGLAGIDGLEVTRRLRHRCAALLDYGHDIVALCLESAPRA